MENAQRILLKLNPGVRNNQLNLSAGQIWFGVGLMLIGYAFHWLKPVVFPDLLLLILAGQVLTAGIYLFGFSILVRKDIKHIPLLEGEKVGLFAFQGCKSYPLVAFMIFLSVYLRMYSPFPKPALAILYIGIGGGLISASLHYFTIIAEAVFSTRSGAEAA